MTPTAPATGLEPRTGGLGEDSRGGLCVIGCAAPPALRIADLLKAAVADGWHVGLVLTPTAAHWLGGTVPALGRLTGRDVRTTYSPPGQAPPWSLQDAVLIAPATANTLNKCAAGISDNLALGLINEAIGRGVPVVALACISHDCAHPAWRNTLATLGGAGAVVIGADLPTSSPFGWREGLDRLAQLRSRRVSPDGETSSVSGIRASA